MHDHWYSELVHEEDLNPAEEVELLLEEPMSPLDEHFYDSDTDITQPVPTVKQETVQNIETTILEFEEAEEINPSTEAQRKSNKSKLPESQSDDTGIHQCPICPRFLTSSVFLERHLKTHDKHIECPGMSCNLKFAEQSALERHYARAHTKVQCDLCDQTYNSRVRLRIHRNGHAMRFECDICKKRFPSYSVIKIHMVTHSGYKQYVCTEPGCGKAFRYSMQLLAHRRAHLGQGGKRYVCDLCGKAFRDNVLLRLHVQYDHLNIRAAQCSMCPKAFKDNDRLRTHFRRVHTDERPLQCRAGGCAIMFRNHGTRKAHERRDHPDM